MYEIVPRRSLVKYGSFAVGGFGGGIVLFILRSIATTGSGAVSWGGITVGGILALIGYGLSRSKDDKILGVTAIGAGALTIIASLPIVGWLAGGLMWVGGFGLIAAGIVNLFKFFRGRKTRM